jgi:hypothetical protein
MNTPAPFKISVKSSSLPLNLPLLLWVHLIGLSNCSEIHGAPCLLFPNGLIAGSPCLSFAPAATTVLHPQHFVKLHFPSPARNNKLRLLLFSQQPGLLDIVVAAALPTLVLGYSSVSQATEFSILPFTVLQHQSEPYPPQTFDPSCLRQLYVCSDASSVSPIIVRSRQLKGELSPGLLG